MVRRVYHAKSISGAQSRVRHLEGLLDQYKGFVEDLKRERDAIRNERRLMAMLAAEGPCFNNPITFAAAQQIRDRILRQDCGLLPDGKYIPPVSTAC